MIGVKLDNRYELLALLGRGAYGAVYRAHDATLDRDVAVKVLTTPALDAESRETHPRRAKMLDAGATSDDEQKAAKLAGYTVNSADVNAFAEQGNLKGSK